MSRGLTEEPESPEPKGATPEEMDDAIQELFSMVSFLFAKVDALEKVMGHAMDLPENEAADTKNVRGL